jgi:hypothetical protein
MILFKVLTKKICDRSHFTISELLCEFPQITQNLLYKIITVRLCYHRFCTWWVLKMLMGAHKMQRMARLYLFRAIPQRWTWIPQSHRMRNRWWNLGFICECWNQSAVKAPYKLKKFEQMLSASKKADSNCFLGQEMCADGGIHTTRYHNNVRSVLWNMKKLHRTIQNKSHRMLISAIELVHDNMRSHTATHIWALLEHFNRELFDHPP